MAIILSMKKSSTMCFLLISVATLAGAQMIPF